MVWCCFFFQAEDGIRDLVRSRGLGDVYKRQRVSGAPGVRRQPQAGAAADAPDELGRDGPGTLNELSLIHI